MAFEFVDTEVSTQSTGFAGNEFTEVIKGLPIRKKGEKGRGKSFVIAYATKADTERAEKILSDIARNSTDEFSVAKRLHKGKTLDKNGQRTDKKDSAVIEFWKAEKITRKRSDGTTETVAAE